MIILGLIFITFVLVYILHAHYKNNLQKQQSRYINLLKSVDLPIYFSQDYIKQESLRLTFHRKQKLLNVLQMMAIKNPLFVLPMSRKVIKEYPLPDFCLLNAELELLDNQYENADQTLSMIKNPQHLSASRKAKYEYLKGKYQTYITDMESASHHFSNALNFYRSQWEKHHLYQYEYAECLNATAQMYRLSNMLDNAFELFLSARKLFESIPVPAKQIEVDAYMGMMELSRENHQVAKEYLDTAQKLAQKYKFNKTKADIKNWYGMLHCGLGDIKSAQKNFTTALNKAKTLQTKAFAAEMLARIYTSAEHKNIDKAMEYIKKSITFNKKINNSAGIFESEYLRAEIYFNQKEYTKSRQILTSLIKRFNTPSGTYYPANAYTLLGMIEFQKGRLNHAANLFKQAVDMEHSRCRFNGAIADYNNLAFVARCQGEMDLAQKYLSAALKIAEEIGDTELTKRIKNTYC